MLRFLLLLVFILFTSGCAYVGYGEIGEVKYKGPDRPESGYQWGSGYFIDSTWTDEFLKHSTEGEFKKFITPSSIEAVWGKPENVTIENNNKTVTYNRGLRWRGFVAVIIVPIPIAIPVGHRTVTLSFENDRLKGWETHGSHRCLSVIGFNFIPTDPEGKSLGFKAVSECDWHKDMTPYNGEMACNFFLYDKCFPKNDVGIGTGKSLK